MTRKITFKNCRRIVRDIELTRETIDELRLLGVHATTSVDDDVFTFTFDDDTCIEQVMTWIIDNVDRHVQIIDNLNSLWNKLRRFVGTDNRSLRIDMLKYLN